MKTERPPEIGPAAPEGTAVAATVVVAEGRAGLRALLAITLSSPEWRVAEAADSEQAWDVISRVRPAVAVLAIDMPGRGGLELTRAIKATPELAGTRVILLTAHAGARETEASLAAGADLYLAEPFSPLQLMAAVEEALAGG